MAETQGEVAQRFFRGVDGSICEELGEESTPGPIGRLRAAEVDPTG
jgi:hypothetical protein